MISIDMEDSKLEETASNCNPENQGDDSHIHETIL